MPSYSNEVLDNRPIQYYTFSGSSGYSDKSPNGYDISVTGSNYITSLDGIGIAAHYFASSVSINSIPNPTKCFSSNSPNNIFTINFWHHPTANISSYNPTTIFKTSGEKILSSFDDTCYVEFVSNSYKLVIVEPSGKKNYASVDNIDMTSPNHVSIISSGTKISIVVNNIYSSPITLSNSFSYTTSNTLKINSKCISNFSVFNYILSPQDIYQMLVAGLKHEDLMYVSDKDDGIYYPMFKDKKYIAFQDKVDKDDFDYAQTTNLVVDKNGFITLRGYDLIRYTDSTDVDYFPAISSKKATISSGKFLKLDSVVNMLGYAAGSTRVTLDVGLNKTKKQNIFTILLNSATYSYNWYIDTDNKLKVEEILNGASTIYTYNLANLNATVSFDFIFYRDNIYVITADTTSPFTKNIRQVYLDGVNLVNSIPINISISNDSSVYFGTGTDLVGGEQVLISDIIFHNYLPIALADYTVIQNSDLTSNYYVGDLSTSTCAYTFYDDAGNNKSTLGPRVQGSMVYSVPFMYDGQYDGSFVEFDLPNDGDSSITTSYTGTGGTGGTAGGTLFNKYQLTSINPGGTLGSGLLTFNINLKTQDLFYNKPKFSKIFYGVYSEPISNFESDTHTNNIYTNAGVRHFTNQQYDNVNLSSLLSGVAIPNENGLQIPYSLNTSIEFLFNTSSGITGTSGNYLIYSNTATGSTGITGNAKYLTLSNTGPTGAGLVIKNNNFDYAYINGTTLSSGNSTTLNSYGQHHVIAVNSTTFNTAVYLNSNGLFKQSPNSGSGSISYRNISTYNYALSAAQVADHYEVALGYKKISLGSGGSIGTSETQNIFLYSYAWSTSQ